MKIGIEFCYDLENSEVNKEIFMKFKATGFDAIDFNTCDNETDFYKLEGEKFTELLN